MARSLNKVMLIGRLGRDPEIRYSTDGLAIANFSVATDESYKDRSGNRQTQTEWHRIVAFGKLAEICGEYLMKGRQVYIEGRLKTRSWTDKNGDKKYTTENNPKKTDFSTISAVRIPHFYNGFYVYKYAIGQIAANIFFAKYKNEGKPALEFYIDKFLKSGCRANPLDILKEAGIDLLDPKVYEEGFNSFEKDVNEYIKLGKEIFKLK